MTTATPRLSLGLSPATLVNVDSETLAYLCGNTLCIKGPRTGKQKIIVGSGRRITALAVNPAHGLIAIAEQDGNFNASVSIRQPDGVQVERLGSLGSSPITGLAFSWDGKRLAVATGAPELMLSIVEWKGGQAVGKVALPHELSSVSFCPFDQSLLCAQGPHETGIVHVKKELQGHSILRVAVPAIPSGPVTCHVWDRDGSLLAATEGGEVIRLFITKVTDPDTAATPMLSLSAAQVVRVPFRPASIALSRYYLALGGRGANLCILPLPQEEGPYTLDDPEAFSVGGGAVAEVASLVYGGSDMASLYAATSDGRLLSLELRDTGIQSVKLMDCHSGAVRDISPLHDGKHAASCGDDGTLRVWDLQSGALVSVLHLGGPQHCMAASLSRGLLALGSAHGVVRILSVSNPNKPHVIFRSRLHTSAVVGLAFSPMGDLLASGGKDRRVFFTRASAQPAPLGFIPSPEDLVGMAWPSGDGGLGPALGILETGELLWVTPPTSGLEIGADLAVPGKDAGLRRMKLDGHLDAFAGAVLPDGSSALLAVSTDRSVRLYTVPKELQAWGGPKGRVHHSDAKGAGPEKRARAIALCPSQDLFAYGGMDGTLSLRPFNGFAHSRPQGEQVLYDVTAGGIASVAFDATGAYIVTGGMDGSIFVCAFPGNATHVTRPLEQPPSLPSLLAEEEGLKAETADEPHVVEELKARALAAAQLQAQPIKDGIRSKLDALRARFQECVEASHVAPELERLTPEELIVDIRLKGRMEEAGRQRVQKIRDAVLRENKVLEVIHHRIKAMVWDAMELHGQRLSGLQGNVVVRNFPVPRPDKMDRLGDRASLLRQVEMQENFFASQESGDERFRTSKSAKKPEERPEELGRSPIPRTSTIATVDEAVANISENGEGPKQGIEKIMYSPFDLSQPSRRVTQIHLLRRRVREVKQQFNAQFAEMVKKKHAEVDKILDTNQRIQEIVRDLARLARRDAGDADPSSAAPPPTITEFLGGEPLFVPSTDDLEEHESVLTVRDEEITVERYLSPEERARVEAARRAEEARLAALKKDDVFDRALKMMMGGALESRDADEEDLDLVKPDWMNGDPAKFNEEQTKQHRAFIAREQQVAEEREKKRSALEREIKALRSLVDEGCRKFDEALTELYKVRLGTKAKIHEVEMRMIRLASGLDGLRMYSADGEQQVLSRLEELSLKKSQAERAAAEFKHQVDTRQVFVEGLLSEDKALDKAFKKEFADTGDYLPALQQLFRRRIPCRRADVPVELQGSAASRRWLFGTRTGTGAGGHSYGGDGRTSTPPDRNQGDAGPPFGGVHRGYHEPYPNAGKEEVELDYYEPLDVTQDMPEGLAPHYWERLVEARAAKVESELRIRMEQRALDEMQRRLTQLQRDEGSSVSELSQVETDLHLYRQTRESLMYDLEIPLTVRQGQVEVDAPSPGDDSILMHRTAVERVNSVIRDHGDRKVEILTAIKDFKKGIYELQWVNQRLEMEAEDWVEKTREFQLLRVTKDLQQALRSGTAENSSSLEVQLLEKNLEHQQRLHVKNLADRDAALRRVEVQISERRKQNRSLQRQLGDLEDMITDERRIQVSQAAEKGDEAAQDEVLQRRMRSLVTQARLRDIAKAQEAEIQALRAELERVRLRTFPSFVERGDNLPDEKALRAKMAGTMAAALSATGRSTASKKAGPAAATATRS